MIVILYSRWLTTAKPIHQGHSFKNTLKLVPSHPLTTGLSKRFEAVGFRDGEGCSGLSQAASLSLLRQCLLPRACLSQAHFLIPG